MVDVCVYASIVTVLVLVWCMWAAAPAEEVQERNEPGRS
jgi:hypothetical protein